MLKFMILIEQRYIEIWIKLYFWSCVWLFLVSQHWLLLMLLLDFSTLYLVVLMTGLKLDSFGKVDLRWVHVLYIRGLLHILSIHRPHCSFLILWAFFRHPLWYYNLNRTSLEAIDEFRLRGWGDRAHIATSTANDTQAIVGSLEKLSWILLQFLIRLCMLNFL